jgi:hypothetical protein
MAAPRDQITRTCLAAIQAVADRFQCEPELLDPKAPLPALFRPDAPAEVPLPRLGPRHRFKDKDKRREKKDEHAANAEMNVAKNSRETHVGLPTGCTTSQSRLAT